jgi:DnaJ-class molecular chaperone
MTQGKTCPWCHGSGEVRVPKTDRKTGVRCTVPEVCNMCNGTGTKKS